MDISYKHLKKSHGKSIVLERQENIIIERDENKFIRRKNKLIREKFSCPNVVQAQNGHVDKCSKSGAKSKLVHAVQSTSIHLKELAYHIDNEIDKLKRQRDSFLHQQKKTKMKKNAAIQSDKTWEQNLNANKTKDMNNVEFTIEKYSSQHKFVCTSPRYARDEQTSCRPRMRTIGLQKDSHRHETPVNFAAKNSENILNFKGDIASNSFPLIYCFEYGNTTGCKNQYMAYHSHKSGGGGCHKYCQNYNITDRCNGLDCNQKTYMESVFAPCREYSYCCDEYHYDYSNNCIAPPPHNSCTPLKKSYGGYCLCNRNNMNYSRCGSDLNTEEFFQRRKLYSPPKKYEVKPPKYSKSRQDMAQVKEMHHKSEKSLRESTAGSHRKSSKGNKLHENNRKENVAKNQFNGLSSSQPKNAPSTKDKFENMSIRQPDVIELIDSNKSIKKESDDSYSTEKYSLETLKTLQRMQISKYQAAKPVKTDVTKDSLESKQSEQPNNNHIDILNRVGDEDTIKFHSDYSEQSVRQMANVPDVQEGNYKIKDIKQEVDYSNGPIPETAKKTFNNIAQQSAEQQFHYHDKTIANADGLTSKEKTSIDTRHSVDDNLKNIELLEDKQTKLEESDLTDLKEKQLFTIAEKNRFDNSKTVDGEEMNTRASSELYLEPKISTPIYIPSEYPQAYQDDKISSRSNFIHSEKLPIKSLPSKSIYNSLQQPHLPSSLYRPTPHREPTQFGNNLSAAAAALQMNRISSASFVPISLPQYVPDVPPNSIFPNIGSLTRRNNKCTTPPFQRNYIASETNFTTDLQRDVCGQPFLQFSDYTQEEGALYHSNNKLQLNICRSSGQLFKEGQRVYTEEKREKISGLVNKMNNNSSALRTSTVDSSGSSLHSCLSHKKIDDDSCACTKRVSFVVSEIPEFTGCPCMMETYLNLIALCDNKRSLKNAKF